VYAATNADAIYKSTDSGETWVVSFYGQIKDQVFSIAADPAMPSTIYAGTGMGAVLQTVDGEHWAHVADEPNSCVVSGFAFDSSTSSVYFSSSTLSTDIVYHAGLGFCGFNPQTGNPGGSIFRRSGASSTWEVVTSGLAPSDVRSLAQTGPGFPFTLFAGTNGGGVFQFPAPRGAEGIIPVTPPAPASVTER
jgi:photosystem II stability/assembly factor-like uncharacterized protein